MSKSTHFTGQPILNQIISLINKQKLLRTAKTQGADHYVKHFDSYTHLVTMLYAVIGHFDSLREVVVGLLSNANKLSHLGVSYLVKRSTLSDANKRRSSSFFESIYLSLVEQYRPFLSDSRLKNTLQSKLYVMDSTTITLFKQILKGAGRNPKRGKKKGGIKAHTVIKYDDRVPCLINYSSAATHDHVLLKSLNLPNGSFVVFDMAYVDYKIYQSFTEQEITYVTKMKANAVYLPILELDISDDADQGVIKDETVSVKYGNKKELIHVLRRIAYWNNQTNKLEVFITNNTALDVETIIEIYRKRWVIETLFKQLKQNFPLKYFLGDNVNAIEIQIWVTLIANLLLTVVKKQVKRKWAFSNMVTFIRINLMAYINLYDFLQNPEKAWMQIQKSRTQNDVLTLFSSV